MDLYQKACVTDAKQGVEVRFLFMINFHLITHFLILDCGSDWFSNHD
jgi:hypothetical protein